LLKNINAAVIDIEEGKTEWVNSSFEKCQVILRKMDRNKARLSVTRRSHKLRP
jgi:hypothetical protein